MRRYHLVKCHFWRTTKATPEWLSARYKLFAETTLKSLQRQRFQDFRIWLSCDSGMRETVGELRSLVPQGCFFTFGEHLPQARDSGMVSEDLERLHAADYVYVTRLDSDDLYCRDALAIVDAVRPLEPGRTEAAIFARGWMRDDRSDRTAVYCNPSSPFHAMLFPRQDFVDPARYARLDYGDHSRVRSCYPYQVLPDYKFCVKVHGGNFITDMSYSAEKDAPVPMTWSTERFLEQPVVFDVDDFSDQRNCLPELDALKARYAGFKATAFTIPLKTSAKLLEQTKTRPWLELAVHGITHEPNEELRSVSGPRLLQSFERLPAGYTRGFRPPGWFINEEHVRACNDADMWVALHARDERRLGPLCQHGFYVCSDRNPYSHHHTHDSCGNWLKKDLQQLLTKWPADQQFSWVSEALVK